MLSLNFPDTFHAQGLRNPKSEFDSRRAHHTDSTEKSCSSTPCPFSAKTNLISTSKFIAVSSRRLSSGSVVNMCLHKRLVRGRSESERDLTSRVEWRSTSVERG